MKVITINLEEGMPSSRDAKQMLEQEILRARKMKISVLKIIHGYGSTGVGGKIKVAVLSTLGGMKEKKIIKLFITGDKWSIFDETSRLILDICPELSKDRDLERFNTGITLVLVQ